MKAILTLGEFLFCVCLSLCLGFVIGYAVATARALRYLGGRR
jgi:hypothetical protein